MSWWRESKKNLLLFLFHLFLFKFLPLSVKSKKKNEHEIVCTRKKERKKEALLSESE